MVESVLYHLFLCEDVLRDAGNEDHLHECVVLSEIGKDEDLEDQDVEEQ